MNDDELYKWIDYKIINLKNFNCPFLPSLVKKIGFEKFKDYFVKSDKYERNENYFLGKGIALTDITLLARNITPLDSVDTFANLSL